MSKRYKGITMVIFAAIFWGFLATFSQILMQYEKLDPSWLITVRLLGSGILLIIWNIPQKDRKTILSIWSNKRNAIDVILIGIIGFLGVQYTYFISIQTGNAVTTSLLHFLAPSLVLCYLALRNKKLPYLIEVFALILAFVGTFLLVTNGSIEQLTVPFFSVFWGVFSALSGAFYLIFPVRIIKEKGSAEVVGWGMLVGGIVMSFFSPPWNIPELNFYSAALLAYIVLFGTLFGFLLYLGSLKYIGSVEAGILSCIEPFVAAISAFFLLNRTLGVYESIGGLLIIATVCIITISKDRQNKTVL